MRFYETRTTEDEAGIHYYVTVGQSEVRKDSVEIEVSQKVYDAIIELQREYWRIEQRESRYTVHIEAVPDCYIPSDVYARSPEQLYMDELDKTELAKKLLDIPEPQRRRFLLRYLYDLPVRRIAEIEGCSMRAVEYSLVAACKRLRESFDSSDGC